jgi:folate-binding protein YgfZ
MARQFQLILRDRGVLALTGEDRVGFLQGLVSNDVAKASAARALYAAFLTPQGRFLHDFFLVAQGDTLLLDCEGGRRADLLTRLSRFRLRAKVTLDDVSERYVVAALVDGGAGEPGEAAPLDGGIAFVDPRLAALGRRAILPVGEASAALAASGLPPGDEADYDRLRLGLGVPDGSRDLPVEKAYLLENGFDELNGVDWQKGCYMGQELTARTKYRGLVRKRLMPVAVAGPLPAAGTQVTLAAKDAGEMRSGRDGIGLALLRLDVVEEARTAGLPLMAGQARLTPGTPAWMGS